MLILGLLSSLTFDPRLVNVIVNIHANVKDEWEYVCSIETAFWDRCIHI